jgi:ubiquitin-protein ligase
MKSVLPPWIRRLQEEYEELRLLERESSLLTIEASGVAPTNYRIQLCCRGLFAVQNQLAVSEDHCFDLTLSPDFPNVAPTIVWRTAIFHPNFEVPNVCVGDHWYPGSSLSDLCVALCEMVQYKNFNIYDPLNPVAAAWVYSALCESQVEFPLDRRPVRDLAFNIQVALKTSNGDGSETSG